MATNTTAGANRYDELNKKYMEAQNQSAQQQIDQANKNADQQLRQAYIAKMQGQRNLNEALTRQGIRGGVSETSNLALNTNYQNNRNNIYKNRNAAISEINTNADQNKLNFQLQNDSAKLAYIENIEAENREVAREQKAENKVQKIDAWEAKYSKYYSIDALNKALNKAKTPQERAIINARIGYIKSHKKGY